MTPFKELEMNFGENVIMSGMAAFLSKFAYAGFGQVKYRMRSEKELLRTGDIVAPYEGFYDAFLRTQHIHSLYDNRWPQIVRYIPAQALNFAFKDLFRSWFGFNENDSQSVNFTKNVASGGFAGISSLLICYTIHDAQNHLSADKEAVEKGTQVLRRYTKGPVRAVDYYRKAITTEGVKGLYRGFYITSVGIFLYRGLYFGLYDSLKPVVFGQAAGFVWGWKDIKTTFIFAYIVTVTAGIITFPVETIRVRMLAPGGAMKYSGPIDCALKVVSTEGFMSLMRGVWFKTLPSVAGAGALAFVDIFKNWYGFWRIS